MCIPRGMSEGQGERRRGLRIAPLYVYLQGRLEYSTNSFYQDRPTPPTMTIAVSSYSWIGAMTTGSEQDDVNGLEEKRHPTAESPQRALEHPCSASLLWEHPAAKLTILQLFIHRFFFHSFPPHPPIVLSSLPPSSASHLLLSRADPPPPGLPPHILTVLPLVS